MLITCRQRRIFPCQLEIAPGDSDELRLRQHPRPSPADQRTAAEANFGWLQQKIHSTAMPLKPHNAIMAPNKWYRQQRNMQMALERRHSHRIEMNRDVQILYRGRSFMAKAANLSKDGVFLKTEALTFPVGMMVEFHMGIEERQWQIPGLVIWSSRNGIGLMFQTPQTELYQEALTREVDTEQAPYPVAIQFPAASMR